MKYANPDKSAVIATNPKDGHEWTVPRGHRFWSQWGIDQTEKNGDIEAADPTPELEAQ
ncbi:hypothetical protein [Vibrio tetraodonis]|uniref:hypothetical protein n=1 Tax=Vibrio tetraodonis TaxID=2231647 RepID=UPI00196426B5|nr:hypothetical protein [Vibrio tetraodonis]